MKIRKILALFILITLMICTFTSCNNSNDDTSTEADTTTNTNTEDATSTDETQTSIDETTSSDEATSSDETTGPDEDTSKDDDGNKTDPSVPNTPNGKNETATQSLSVKKYYKEITSRYTKIADGVVYENNQIFLDGVFEVNKTSQYKIVSSYSELQVFTLLNFDDVEENVFEDNYIVAILHYFIGPSCDSTSAVGFYNANFTDIENAKITLDNFYRYDESETCDERDVYKLYFIIVPKDEVGYTDKVCDININTNKLEQYQIEAYNIENTTEKTTAYYLKDKASKEKIEILSSASSFWPSYPCIAIHLDKVIETDFIVNNFKYENGEIYITIEIYQKTEMTYLHRISANLIVVSLFPHYDGLEIDVPDNIPTDCKINIIFKTVI